VKAVNGPGRLWRGLGPGAALLALLLCCCATFCPAALAASPAGQEILVTGAHIVEHGLYGQRTPLTTPGGASILGTNPLNTINGIQHTAANYELLARSGRVLARRGTAIGIGYVITGRPKGASVPVELVVQHPDIVNQETGIAGMKSHVEAERVIGTPTFAFWSFDTEDGLVPGVYVFTVRCQGQELARRAFSVRVVTN